VNLHAATTRILPWAQRRDVLVATLCRVQEEIERLALRPPWVLAENQDALVVYDLLERELGRVNADHNQPPILILFGPSADVRERPSPIDA